MKSTRWFKHCLPALIGVCALWASSAAQGQYFLDDFEDGNPADGSPVTWVVDPPFDGGTHVIEQGSYVLTPDDVSDYPNTDLSELDLVAEGRLFRSVTLRTTARLLASPLGPNLYIGLAGRSTINAQGEQATGVWGAVRSGGRLTLGVFNTEINQDQVWQGSYGPANTPIVGQDINLQLDIFADSAALTAWNVGDPRPAQPQIVVPNLPDYVPAQGRVGLWTVQNIARGRAMAPVAYHSFEAAPVPEPTCLAMVAIALAGCLRRPLRRSGRCLASTAGATLLTAVMVVAAQPANAATIFYDDFEDGSLIDGQPVSWTPGQDANLKIENGSLIVTGRSVPLAVSSTGPLTDVSIQVRMRVLEGDYAGIAGRRTTGTRRGYFTAVGEYLDQGERKNDAFLAYAGSLETLDAQDVSFDPKLEDVILQLDIFGNKISYWAWPADEPRPATPIGSVVDDFLSSVSGGIYLWASSPGLSGALTGSAAFRYVHVANAPIPEPSTLGLLGLVAARGMRRNSRRRLPAGR